MIKMMNEKEIRNEFINCIEGSHTLNLAISVLEDREQLQKENKLLKHRLETANDYIESRKENMIPEHYDDLKYIINECDLNSSW